MAKKSASKSPVGAKSAIDESLFSNTRAALEKGSRSKWWRRRGSKDQGFRYEDSSGARIKSNDDLARIKSLVIPPGYLDVRISPSARSKLQAIALDAAGRVQYRYRPSFTAIRAGKKYGKLQEFGERLPALRRATREHLSDPGLTKARVIALMVRIMGETYFRVGAERSASRYKTYGMTTFRNRHVSLIDGDRVLFKFVGKHHIRQEREIVDAELAAMIQEMKQIPCSRLFAYLDEPGKARPISPSEINSYIKQVMGREFSCKDFRTWGGTLYAARALSDLGPAKSERQIKRNIVAATRAVAEILGNTPAVCRSSYIHPDVFKCYRQGKTLGDYLKKATRYVRRHPGAYSEEEAALLLMMENANTTKK